MKKFYSVVSLILIISSFLLCGCNKKSFTQPLLSRDSYNTGGSLTFIYDSQANIAYFGGNGEVVQYYDKDIAKGWTEKGCRVGVSMLIPNDLKDFKSATAKINEKELNSNDFIVEIDENTIVAQFQPIVNEEKNVIKIEITWAENSQTQEYKIIIKEGTLFMNE